MHPTNSRFSGITPLYWTMNAGDVNDAELTTDYDLSNAMWSRAIDITATISEISDRLNHIKDKTSEPEKINVTLDEVFDGLNEENKNKISEAKQ